MATVRYFWRGFMYLQCSHPLIYHLLPNVWKASYTISASIFVDVPYWQSYSTDKFISCVVPGPSQWFFHFGEEIVIAWTHVGWVRWMFQNLPLPVDPGGPVVILLPLDARFAGSNPAGVDEFFQSVKILSMTSFEREVKPWVPCSRFTARKRTSSRN